MNEIKVPDMEAAKRELQNGFGAKVVELAKLHKRIADARAEMQTHQQTLAKMIDEFRKATVYQQQIDQLSGRLESLEEHEELLEEDVRQNAEDWFVHYGDGKQMKLAEGAVTVRNETVVTILDEEFAIEYTRERAPALLVTKPKNQRSWKTWLRKCREKTDPDGVYEAADVTYEPKVLFSEDKLLELLPDEEEIPF